MPDLLEFFSQHPEVAKELYYWASEIVDDFDDYGPILQSNEVGEYDESTTLGRLRTVRDSIIAFLEARSGGSAGPEAPIATYPWRNGR
jgi:hypothetical protein